MPAKGASDVEGEPEEPQLAHDEARRDGKHLLVDPSQWPWLPTQSWGDLAPHPYCENCGQVKAMGSQRALDEGGLVNLLSNLKKVLDREGLTMTEAQRRLILKELKEADADDPFTLTRERQLEKVTSVASRYLGIHEDALATYLRTC